MDRLTPRLALVAALALLAGQARGQDYADTFKKPETAPEYWAAMKYEISIGNETFKLPAPFLVIATQNPIEQSGTFELPEAQLDRFMLCHRLGYPTTEEEKDILKRNAALGVRREV